MRQLEGIDIIVILTLKPSAFFKAIQNKSNVNPLIPSSSLSDFPHLENRKLNKQKSQNDLS